MRESILRCLIDPYAPTSPYSIDLECHVFCLISTDFLAECVGSIPAESAKYNKVTSMSRISQQNVVNIFDRQQYHCHCTNTIRLLVSDFVILSSADCIPPKVKLFCIETKYNGNFYEVNISVIFEPISIIRVRKPTLYRCKSYQKIRLVVFF